MLKYRHSNKHMTSSLMDSSSPKYQLKAVTKASKVLYTIKLPKTHLQTTDLSQSIAKSMLDTFSDLEAKLWFV